MENNSYKKKKLQPIVNWYTFFILCFIFRIQHTPIVLSHYDSLNIYPFSAEISANWNTWLSLISSKKKNYFAHFE